MEGIYLVYAEAVPTKAAINADDIDDADAIIFVSAKSQDEAQILSRSVLIDYGYHLTNVLSVSVPTLSTVLKLGTKLLPQYHAAKIQGYAFELIVPMRD